MQNNTAFPLISVIIPTYNYAHFIQKAIDSVQQQTYPNVEIIVVDDGSVDNTKEVVGNCPAVCYFYHSNRGLSASRNAGINKASGKYLVFLDADDWLEKEALHTNYSVLQSSPEAVFVSGNYYLLRKEENTIEAVKAKVQRDHYCHLLRSNYIGMHAAVMFRRWVFNEFRYDEALRSCEDYDLYLNIARKYPVLHHQQFIATYNFHATGLSHNYTAMMETVRAVIKKQAPFLQTPEEHEAYQEGMSQWKQYETLMMEHPVNA